MKSQKVFSLTTPIYYANAKPHIGHAYTTVVADVMARWQKQKGRETFLLTGTDEHGAKIAQKAEELGKTPQELVNEISGQFKQLWNELDIDYQSFIRTTDKKHIVVVQKVLEKLYEQGLIYKGEYKGLYCFGCEQFKKETELVDGKCPDHGVAPEFVREESYMLRLSDKQDELLQKIESDELRIRPKRFRREILSFLEKEKLEDLSISRKNVEWGIPLPFDKSQTVYVWFDAFLSYLTGLGWQGGNLEGEVSNLWPLDLNLIGKDILRVHATIWPIMLMHLGLELPKQIFVHGHILSEGKKMSKSVGNVIAIDEMLKEFGAEGTCYLLLSAGTIGEDIDLTMERMMEKYNADLANGLGNLLSRVVTLARNFQFPISEVELEKGEIIFTEDFEGLMDSLQFDRALKKIWRIVQDSNKLIEETKPWELAKSDRSEFEKVMRELVLNLHKIAELLKTFLPQTARRIKKQLKTGERGILFEKIKTN